MPTDLAAIPFSIENFIKLFEVSESKKYLSVEEIAQIQTAIEQKNTQLLQNLYQTLLAEKTADNTIVACFLDKKQESLDEAAIQAADIYNQFIIKPKREEMAHREAEENGNPEDILSAFPHN